MARRKRIARDRPQQVTARIQSQIERRLPFFDPLDDDAVVRLEAQVDWIIQDVGIAFRDDQEALTLWREQPDVRIEEDVVRAPADWIRELCRQAPSSFTQLARNPERSVIIGGGLYVAGVRGARLYRGALAASTAVSVWIAVSMLASDRRRR